VWRSKKLIIGVVLAAVMLVGSIGGVALADDPENEVHPRVEFLERLADKLGITVDELQEKIAEVRAEMPARSPGDWRGRPGPAGRLGNPGDMFGVDIGEDAWKEAMEEARERIQAGEDRHEVMSEILERFGIDVEEMEARCAEAWESRRGSFGPGFGFRVPGGMGRFHGFGDRNPPAE
jgi:hypothetical protein